MSGQAPRRKGMKAVKTKQVAKPYEPTPQERTAIAAYLTRKRETSPAPRMKVSEKGGVAQISPDHEDPALATGLLMQALGATDEDFLDGFLRQLANAGSQGPEVDETGLNFMLSVVKGVEPRDQVEAMLAAQMAAVHMATMNFACGLSYVSAERAFGKLARIFTAQVEALKRYRTGGEQRVVVEHVHVYEGGRAIVGTVNHGKVGGAGVSRETEEQPDAKALTYAPGETLPCQDPKGHALPRAGRARETALPDARRGKG